MLSACKGEEQEASTARQNQPQVATIAMPTVDAAAPAEFEGLHNVVAYDDDILSGSVPHGEVSFRTLAAMGVKTIISVDGAQPDVEAARAFGIRYVHLPITYSGIEDVRRLEIARAIRDLPGPIYFHCHHGKHRSAAAAGAALATLGRITNEEAAARMKVSGTAPSYAGLYQCVTLAAVATPAQIDSVSGDFPERHQTRGMVQSMVEIDHAFEHLKQIEAAGWQTPPDHPDLVPAAEAGLLANLLRHLPDDPQVQGDSSEIIDWLRQAATEAAQLEAGIVEGLDAVELSARLKAIDASCNACHARYRDN